RNEREARLLQQNSQSIAKVLNQCAHSFTRSAVRSTDRSALRVVPGCNRPETQRTTATPARPQTSADLVVSPQTTCLSEHASQIFPPRCRSRDRQASIT